MIRNFYTNETTFNDEETSTVALAIDARCEQCLNLYRSVPDCPAREYFGKEYLKASVLYKELFGTEYPADITEGDIPSTADSAEGTTPDSSDCTPDCTTC